MIGLQGFILLVNWGTQREERLPRVRSRRPGTLTHSGLVITCCGDPMVAVRDMNTP